MTARRRNGLALGLIVAVVVQMTAATNTSRSDEPWPVLLSSEPASFDPAVALLQQRASGSLERLVQAAEQPL